MNTVDGLTENEQSPRQERTHAMNLLPFTASTILIILAVGLLGVMEYYKAVKINGDHIRIGLLIAVGLFGGTFFGAKISLQLPAAQLQRVFSIFLMLIAARLGFSAAV